MLIGTLLGLVVGVDLVRLSLHHQLHLLGSPWLLVLWVVVGAFGVAKLITGIIPGVIGTLAMFIGLSGLVAGIIATFNGQASYVPALLVAVVISVPMQWWARRALMVQRGAQAT